jgi:hypothetical protein
MAHLNSVSGTFKQLIRQMLSRDIRERPTAVDVERALSRGPGPQQITQAQRRQGTMAMKREFGSSFSESDFDVLMQALAVGPEGAALWRRLAPVLGRTAPSGPSIPPKSENLARFATCKIGDEGGWATGSFVELPSGEKVIVTLAGFFTDQRCSAGRTWKIQLRDRDGDNASCGCSSFGKRRVVGRLMVIPFNADVGAWYKTETSVSVGESCTFPRGDTGTSVETKVDAIDDERDIHTTGQQDNLYGSPLIDRNGNLMGIHFGKGWCAPIAPVVAADIIKQKCLFATCKLKDNDGDGFFGGSFVQLADGSTALLTVAYFAAPERGRMRNPTSWHMVIATREGEKCFNFTNPVNYRIAGRICVIPVSQATNPAGVWWKIETRVAEGETCMLVRCDSGQMVSGNVISPDDEDHDIIHSCPTAGTIGSPLIDRWGDVMGIQIGTCKNGRGFASRISNI